MTHPQKSEKGARCIFRSPRQGKIHLAPFLLLLAACGGGSGVVVKPQVTTPPPSSPRSEFFVETTQVQSREVGPEAWGYNEAYARLMTETLRTRLQDRGKTLTPPPANVVRTRLYIAYGGGPVKGKDAKRAKAHVEVRLQLLDAATGAAIYTTHTLTPINKRAFGWNSPDTHQVIREVLDKAAEDFVSRL